MLAIPYQPFPSFAYKLSGRLQQTRTAHSSCGHQRARTALCLPSCQYCPYHPTSHLQNLIKTEKVFICRRLESENKAFQIGERKREGLFIYAALILNLNIEYFVYISFWCLNLEAQQANQIMGLSNLIFAQIRWPLHTPTSL